MKLSLLEITQDILNDLDSDQVNSIADTIESQQVAQIVKTCYFEMMSNRNWPHTRKLIALQASGNVALPNYLKLPTSVKEICNVRYNVDDSSAATGTYREIRYKEPDAFLRMVSFRNPVDTSRYVKITDPNGVILLIDQLTAPTFWTSFDDQFLVFDSFNIAYDTTLKASKSQVVAYVEPTWSHTDTFVPDLPTEAFSALVEEAKSTASMTLKQMANQKAEQKAKRQNAWLSRKAWVAHGGIQYPSYGRSGKH